jgi:hypothetical protein
MASQHCAGYNTPPRPRPAPARGSRRAAARVRLLTLGESTSPQPRTQTLCNWPFGRSGQQVAALICRSDDARRGAPGRSVVPATTDAGLECLWSRRDAAADVACFHRHQRHGAWPAPINPHVASTRVADNSLRFADERCSSPVTPSSADSTANLHRQRLLGASDVFTR